MNETTEDLVTPEDKLKLLLPHRPWESEPDEANWVDAATGYKCRIVRNEHTGTLCGYVGVPREHRLYGMVYQYAEKNYPFHAHGGLTYSGGMGEGDVYHFFGFDTAHAGDLSPGLLAVTMQWYEGGPIRGETYRTWDYVKNNVQMLAWQLLYYDKGESNNVS